MLTGKQAKRYLTDIITAIDNGIRPSRASGTSWIRTLALPAAVGLSIGVAGCVGDPQEPPFSRDEARAAKADGFMGALCEILGAEPGCDVCLELGWYGDGICDEFCDEPDVADCGEVVALYGVPPLGPEDCSDGIDNDANGLVDCDDPACSGDPACGDVVALYMVPMPEDCSDGIDNDGNGLTDCDDPACSEDPACGEVVALYRVPMPEDCSDGIDNDGNGLTDCDDPACSEDPACVVVARYMAMFERCADGIDNDGNGLTDCDDPACSEDPACIDSGS